MIESLATEQHLGSTRREGRRDLDTAVGILVGWQRCSTHAAFRELIAVSERHQIPIFAVASALVALASRDSDVRSAGTAAEFAAEREWGLTYLL